MGPSRTRKATGTQAPETRNAAPALSIGAAIDPSSSDLEGELVAADTDAVTIGEGGAGIQSPTLHPYAVG